MADDTLLREQDSPLKLANETVADAMTDQAVFIDHHQPELIADAMPEQIDHSDDHETTVCPFTAGSEILLQLQDENHTRIKARILELFPSTLSCVMVIRLLAPCPFQDTEECVVKLYDRRFSTQLRDDEDAGFWSKNLEQKYQEFVRTGDAAEFFSYWTAETLRYKYWFGGFVCNRDRWSEAKVEAYLQFFCRKTYDLERQAYNLLQDLQGHCVPRVLGEVVLETADDHDTDALDETAPDSTASQSDRSESNWETSEIDEGTLTTCPGLLLQYIKGFPLTDLASHVPPEERQSVCDDAIRTLHQIMSRGICNRDVNTRSFMVQEGTRNVFMMDFGHIWLRAMAEDDREWGRLQANEDEEGAVGYVMRKVLSRDGGGFDYKRSEQALRLTHRYNSESGEKEGGTKEEEEFVRKYLGVI